ncbi:hypothetical protein MRB53_041127 [Persea americana]|nr:hypothetical protein MRB53_041127 [Persea americana]
MSLTAESSPPEPEGYYPRDARDIYKTTFLLRQRLVPDLIPQILELAEYWTEISVKRSAEIRVDDTSAARQRPYLVLPLDPARRSLDPQDLLHSRKLAIKAGAANPADHWYIS